MQNSTGQRTVTAFRRMGRFLSITLLVTLLVMILAACGRRVDESLLPTPVATIAPFVTEIPIPPTRTPTTVPTPIPTVAILMPTATPVVTPDVTPAVEVTAPATEEVEPADESTGETTDASTDESSAEPAAESTSQPSEEATGIDVAEEDETPAVTATAPADEAIATATPGADEEATPAATTTPAPEEEAQDAETSEDAADTAETDEDAAGEETADDAPTEAATSDETETDETETGAAELEVAPIARFRQPTNNAIVPVTFTVQVQVEGITLLATEAPTSTAEVAEGDEMAEGDEAVEAAETSEATPDADETPGTVTETDADSDTDTDSESSAEVNTAADAESTPEADDASSEQTADETAEHANEQADEDAGEQSAAYLFVLVNTPALAAGEAIPVDEPFVVAVDAAGSAALELNPGTYTLGLQLADADFNALPTTTDPIVVSVRADATARSVRIAMPTNGAVVPPQFDVVMAATGLSVEPSGPPQAGAERGASGHFHLLINEEFVAPDQIIPTSETHLHFGAGQLTTTVTLEPGEHVIRLQMADGLHVGLRGEEYRDTITVTVAADAPSPQVMFVEPVDGATVPTTFPVRWAATGLLVEPIGAVLEPGRGHFHVLIDTDFVEAGEVIPTDDAHRHFGAAQLETELTLEPGEYTLGLQMANGAHIALDGEEYQDTITITVSDASAPESNSESDSAPEDDSAVAEPTDEDAAADDDQATED